MRRAFFRLLLGLIAAAPVVSAQAGGVQPPQIVVTATDEVEVAPDRARLLVSIETRGRTPQLATGDNAKIATDVLAALRRAGIAAEQIRTQGLVVSPEYQYPREGGRPTVTGYQGRNSISVEVRDLARLSSAFDAAIAAGATRVEGPSFFLANPDSARRVALAAAVRRARADAEVMALAAAVQLGGTLELTTSSFEGQPMFRAAPMAMVGADRSEATPVSAGLITVRVDVTMRLAIVPRP
ncbi:MAG: SIMPL domain-containing protein [Gemmatimonadaceae bacterium]|nr:SIMPL domain-containing protein [Gemmatimonadaceae bacterium]